MTGTSSFLAKAQPGRNTRDGMKQLIDEQFSFAAKQYKVLAKTVPTNVMPRYYDPKKNKLVTSSTKWWCSGFFPGTLLYIYEYTKDTGILSEAKNRLAILEKEKHFTGNHDLGFMMFCSCSKPSTALPTEIILITKTVTWLLMVLTGTISAITI